MNYDAKRALELLRAGSGRPDAVFRDGQEEAIRHVVEGRQRLLVVQKTGWGKSFVYFIAAKLLREAGAGPALLVSPLLALMRNQIEAAERMGVRASKVTSDNVDSWEQVEEQIRSDEVDVLLISPERLANERFQAEILSRIAPRVALLVIDEAHCISDWGHDFRPHYRLIERIVAALPPGLRLLATTATANNRVMDDLRTVLGPDLAVLRGELHRPSLTLQTIHLEDQAARLAWLATYVPRMAGSGIIYALTVRDALVVTAWLQQQGLAVEAYTSQSGDRRPALEQALLENRVKALVATVALGMGYDKPDLGFVIHYQMPGSVVAYYQQVGRAGRGLSAAYGILLKGAEDDKILDYFIGSAFPTRTEVQSILAALRGAPTGLASVALATEVDISNGRIDRAIKLLSLESPAPIVKDGTRWRVTAAQLSPTFWDRVDRLTALRKVERSQMNEYMALESGHMEFLVRALDGDPSEVPPPPLPPLPADLEGGLAQEAVNFLRRSNLPIEPRKKWPAGELPVYGLRGNIPAALRAAEGRALSHWGDAGWGTIVEEGKYRDGHFPNTLVEACEELLAQWGPTPAPEWVTCIPSRRHPTLVPDFARRLAEALSLPFVEVLVKADDRPEQKTMANSVHQARNLDGSLEVDEDAVRDGPVLLVDDMVDSRWTITIAAWLLRSAGSGEVFPLALASTTSGGQDSGESND